MTAKVMKERIPTMTKNRDMKGSNNWGAETFPPPGKEMIKIKRKQSAVKERGHSLLQT
jgi:hypothetical protein